MKKLKSISIIGTLLLASACSKLDSSLNDSIINGTSGGASNSQLLLNGTYNDLLGLLTSQDQIFSLEENTSDECLVPTRGGDWDDNGVWRVLHAHSWDGTHSQAQSVFLNLGKLESDATTTLASNPSSSIAAQATFLRTLAQYYYVDLFGQVPYRTIAKYNSIDASPVMSASQAIDTMVNNLNSIISALPNGPYAASPDAARFLLMKILLNKQVYLNRQTPAAPSSADMQQVVALGNAIINSGRYSLTAHYFDNFGPNNGGSAPGYGWGTGTEAIFAFPNQQGVSQVNGINSAGINARWMMGLHYNSWNKALGGAGWNGFSTVADFYNSFDASDTMRKGNTYYPGVTNTSGLKVGLLYGQQYNADGSKVLDRNGNPLFFDTAVHLIEPNPLTLEATGVRVIKYPPDYQNYNGGQQGNQLQIFRYSDVLLMVAEAQLQLNNNAGALLLVNQVRSARKAAPLTTLSLVNKSNIYDPNTLVAERQKELYWESWRRQDLIRFGVYLQNWALKSADDPKYLLFPIPATQLVANPNLKQNPGY
ncbi:MAG: RagB/SusD family nutrient uptake outer membrane protein [Sphingobacteriia bacterium]|nr:RagB/SusD family nutrient uptake outer membrane protein [Sphingobacteriia bacterium]